LDAPAAKKAKSLAELEKVHDKRDIGDKKIDERVWGFATADPNVLPEEWRRTEKAFVPNGGENPGFKHLTQKMDIGNSKYVRPDVWHFVDENIGQIPEYRRQKPPKSTFAPAKSG
jgi:hypothetical protein